MKDQLYRIKSQTQSVYQDRARAFDIQRGRSGMEHAWLERFVVSLPKAGAILDLGCGSGEPVSAYLINKGFHLTGIDYAAAMIDMARQRFPDHGWLVQDMVDPLPDRQFNGLISWNGFFHLSPEEQRHALPQFAAAVLPGGNLLLTVGPAEGEITGTVDGAPVYHASLDPAEYRDLLLAAGFATIEFQAEDPDCGLHSVLLALDKQA
ncbi:MAG: methyltransferase domain-containing protein [Rhizobiaceae bacterium]